MRKSLAILLTGAILSTLAPGLQAATPTIQRVLVVPFSALNVPDAQQWIPKAIQESLVADFGRNGYVPIAFQGQLIVEDNATAARLARQAATQYVIRGAAQVVGTDVRLTGQLIDAASGDTVRTAAVTGPSSDLLKLEDQLAAELRGTPAPAPTLAEAPGSTVPAQAQAPAPAQPQIIVITTTPTPAATPSYPTYPPATGPIDYGYPAGLVGYPNYNYPYYSPFLYTPFIVVPSGGGRHHHRGDGHPPTIQQFTTTPPPSPNLPHGPAASFGTLRFDPPLPKQVQ